MWKAETRLLSALFAFDRPYTYISSTPLEQGTIVALPFGAGNRHQYAVVTEVSECHGEDISQYKEILFSLPSPYNIKREGVALAHFMSEQFFAPFGECVRTMLPSGLNVLTIEYYEKGDGFDLLNKDTSPDAVKVAEELSKKGKSELSDISKGSLLSFVRRGFIVKKTEARVHVNEKNETIASLSDTFSKETLDTLLKGCRKKDDYSKVVLHLEGAGEPVPTKHLSEIYSVGTESLKLLEKKGIIKLEEHRVSRQAYDFKAFEKKTEPIKLSDEQQKAYDTLLPLYEKLDPAAALLYGVTGSGKTSVILSLVDKACEENRGVIILVPEIALTLQNATSLYERYGDRVAVIHSGMSEGQRQDAWEALESGKCNIVLGTRSAVFAPVHNLSMIVIDEEQDDSYKSDTSPRYHARDIARFRCAKSGALLLLSSATPDVETFYRAESGKYTLVRLTERFGGATLPDITVADTIDEGLHADSMIGQTLERKIRETLERGEQAILFLNRRGLRKLLVCRDCKSSVYCPNCSVPLTLHSNSGSYRLSCHYCGYQSSPPDACPECKSHHMQYRGFGTEKLEEELKRKFPEARVLRMDADTTVKRFSHDRIISDFAAHRADILIGTQMVTKGHNFPDTTLVGVVMADLSLLVSDYRASENTFSLLTQVVGRAGRSKKKGCAVIQTQDRDGEVINLCTTQDYDSFYKGEIGLRRALMFPPFCSLGMFYLSSDNEALLEKAAEKLSRALEKKLQGEFSDVKIIAYGPFEASPYKLKNKYRKKLIVKWANTARSRALFREVLLEFSQKDGVRCIFDPSPANV